MSSTVITQEDLQSSGYKIQKTYYILRDRGAPIIGINVLLLCPKYKWHVACDAVTKAFRVAWELEGDLDFG